MIDVGTWEEVSRYLDRKSYAWNNLLGQRIDHPYLSVVTPQQYGAKANGVADDANALQSAVTAAQLAGKGVYIPAGTYLTSVRIVNDTAIPIYGDGEGVSIIKRMAGATLASLLHVGPTSGTSTISSPIIDGLTLDGNSSCTDAVLKIRNVTYGNFRNLEVKNGSANGVESETTTTSINTNTLRNNYLNIRSHDNTGIGFLFHGEKDGRFVDLLAHTNSGAGFYFKAFINDNNDLCETTTCSLGVLMSRDNGGNGFTFDGVEKYVAASLISTINSGYGMQFLSSQTGATSNGSNSLHCASYCSRNDNLGGIRVSDSAYMSGAQFGAVYIIGPTQAVGAAGIQLDGVNRVSFNSAIITNVQGNGVVIEQGTPLTVSTDSSHIRFGYLHLESNGNAGAAANHGVAIFNNSAHIRIDKLYSKNAQTSGTNYELNIASTVGPITFGEAVVSAASSGNEFNMGGADINFGFLKSRTGAHMMMLIDGVTAPAAAYSSGHAQIYVDTADGDLKVRFGDGTVKTIVVDT